MLFLNKMNGHTTQRPQQFENNWETLPKSRCLFTCLLANCQAITNSKYAGTKSQQTLPSPQDRF
jgi:hypothetical protein